MIELKAENKNFADVINDFNKTILLLKEQTVSELPLNLDGAGNTSQNCAFIFDWVRRALLARAINLAESYASSINSEEALAATVLCRALLETISHFHHLLRKIDNNLQERNYVQVYFILSRYMLGGEHDFNADHKKLPKIHINDSLESIDKKYGGVSKTYAWLSEFSHPNALGSALMFTEMDKNSGKVHFLVKPNNIANESPALEGAMYLPILSDDWTRSHETKSKIENKWQPTGELFDIFEK